MSSNITPRIGALLVALLIVGFVGGYYLDPAPESGADPKGTYDEGYTVGYEEGSGLVPPDTDGDGIPDAVDQCPNEAGDPAFGGCPVAFADTIIIGTTDSITDLDPALAYDFYTWEVMNNIGEGLMKYIPGTTEVEPGLAESYTASDDGLVYTYELREGLVFNDGTAFNAEAVKWSIERTISLDLDPSWLVSAFVDEVEVIDTYSVKITLQNPVSYFPALLATPPSFPISSNAFPVDEAQDVTDGWLGPYRITNWVKDELLELEANPEYYGEAPKTETVIVRFYGDATALRLAVEAGEIDIAWKTLEPADIADLKTRGELNVLEVPGPYIRYIVINTQTAPFDDEVLRQALAAAIDRQDVADRVFLGTASPLYSLIPEGMWSHIDAFKQKYGERDLDMAEDLLRSAGYSEDNKLIFDLWYTPTHYGDTEEAVATVLKESLEETGLISVTLQSAEWGTYVDYLVEGTMPVFLLGWYPDYVDPDNYLYPFLHSSDIGLGAFYDDPEMDAYLEEGQLATTTAERTYYYVLAQKRLAEMAPHIPFMQGDLVVVTGTDIGGVVLDPTILLRYYLIYKTA